MCTDAFALLQGVLLMQQDTRDKHRAVAYASHTLNQAESNYSMTHQEPLAVVSYVLLSIFGILSSATL